MQPDLGTDSRICRIESDNHLTKDGPDMPGETPNLTHALGVMGMVATTTTEGHVGDYGAIMCCTC